jgi:hypothetical protein
MLGAVAGEPRPKSFVPSRGRDEANGARIAPCGNTGLGDTGLDDTGLGHDIARTVEC